MINKGLKSENKTLTDDNKKLRKQHEADIERFEEYRQDMIKRARKQDEERAEKYADLEKKLRRESRQEVIEAEDDADERVRDAEKDANKRVNAAEDKVQATDLAVSAAVLNVKEAHITEKCELEVMVAQESARADAAENLAAERAIALENMTELMREFASTNGDFADSVVKKLPNVDLSKFNINVDVPAPEVTFVNGSNGGQKK